LVDEKTLGYALCETELKILYKIFKICLICKVKATWVKSVDVYAVTENEGFESSCEAIFAGEMMVIIEVVHNLALFDISEVDVAGLGCPFQIKKTRIDILVLKPSLFC
jgi:hypothetical protein